MIQNGWSRKRYETMLILCTGRSKGMYRTWQDSNLQSPDPKSGALSIRPQELSGKGERTWDDSIRIISTKVAIFFMDLRFVPFLNIIIHRENPISKNLNEGEIRKC